MDRNTSQAKKLLMPTGMRLLVTRLLAEPQIARSPLNTDYLLALALTSGFNPGLSFKCDVPACPP
jgi:hypothetical protein